MEKKDYYDILGVPKDASNDSIKSAYRKAALKFHPDRNPGDHSAEERFKEASEAYEVLSNSEKRSVYDRFGHQGLSGQGFHGFQDVNDIFSSFGSIFEEFFGFSDPFGGTRRGRRAGGRGKRGADLQYELVLSFEESVFGVEKEIEFERATPCKTCNGTKAKPGSEPVTCKTCNGYGQVRQSQGFFSIQTTCPHCYGEGTTIKEVCPACRGKGVSMEKKKLTVKVPGGVDSGLRLRVSGEGEPGLGGGPSGDLYVVLFVREHKHYKREGFDIYMEHPLSIADAALGCQLTIKTLDSEETIKVPAGTQHDHLHTIPGAGVPHLKGVGRGDFHVQFKIVIPRKLTKEQRELLQKFAALSKEDQSSGIFQKLFS